MGCPARLVRQLRPHSRQPLEGTAAIQLLRLVGSLGPRVRLLRHPRGGHGWLQPCRHRQDPAQRTRPFLRARGSLLQFGPALPAPHQHPRGRHQRLLVRPQARRAPAIRQLQLLAY